MKERGIRLWVFRFTATTCFVVAAAGFAACNDPLHGERSRAGGSNAGGTWSDGQGGVSAFGGNSVLGGGPGTSLGGAGGSSTTIVRSPGRICDDGIIERYETCDDGNSLSGDGCSKDCRLEFGYVCPEEGEPCIPIHECGDGVIMPGETCDDGNTLSGDGCSQDCQHVERGWRCRVAARACTPVCGDGLVMGGEACDDGNTADGDGCSHVCQRERCPVGPIDASPFCDRDAPFCGDGIVTPDEECDCGQGGAPWPQGCPTRNDDATYDGCTTQCTWGPHCGDGVVNGAEECDFGSRNGADLGDHGCTWSCTRPPHCGDGKVDVELYEQCDLGPLNGVILDTNLQPTDTWGAIHCTRDCEMVMLDL